MELGITAAVHGRLGTCCFIAAESCHGVLACKPIQQSAGDSMGRDTLTAITRCSPAFGWIQRRQLSPELLLAHLTAKKARAPLRAAVEGFDLVESM